MLANEMAREVTEWLEILGPGLVKGLPGHVPPGKFIRSAKTVVTRVDPTLWDERYRHTLFGALQWSARLGLIPDGPLGDVALMAHADGDVRLWIAPRGLLRLARACGELSTAFFDVVCQRDRFWCDATTGRFEHQEAEGERGHPIRYYARAKWAESGDWNTVILDREEVPHIADAPFPDVLGVRIALYELLDRCGVAGSSELIWAMAIVRNDGQWPTHG
jgi:hypothetical protein